MIFINQVAAAAAAAAASSVIGRRRAAICVGRAAEASLAPIQVGGELGTARKWQWKRAREGRARLQVTSWPGRATTVRLACSGARTR